MKQRTKLISLKKNNKRVVVLEAVRARMSDCFIKTD